MRTNTPIPNRRHQCDVCGNRFEDYYEARDCEKSHKDSSVWGVGASE